MIIVPTTTSRERVRHATRRRPDGQPRRYRGSRQFSDLRALSRRLSR